jgi:hypothetical protein
VLAGAIALLVGIANPMIAMINACSDSAPRTPRPRLPQKLMARGGKNEI